MSNTLDERILYQVAFKAAVDLVTAGVAVPETDDLPAELVALTDLLYDHLSVGITPSDDSGNQSRPTKRSATSKKSSGESKSSGPGKATPKMRKYAVDLLSQNLTDITEYEFDDDDVQVDDINDLTFDQAKEIIEALK